MRIETTINMKLQNSISILLLLLATILLSCKKETQDINPEHSLCKLKMVNETNKNEVYFYDNQDRLIEIHRTNYPETTVFEYQTNNTVLSKVFVYHPEIKENIQSAYRDITYKLDPMGKVIESENLYYTQYIEVIDNKINTTTRKNEYQTFYTYNTENQIKEKKEIITISDSSTNSLVSEEEKIISYFYENGNNIQIIEKSDNEEYTYHNEFNENPNYNPVDFFPNVVPHSKNQLIKQTFYWEGSETPLSTNFYSYKIDDKNNLTIKTTEIITSDKVWDSSVLSSGRNSNKYLQAYYNWDCE